MNREVTKTVPRYIDVEKIITNIVEQTVVVTNFVNVLPSELPPDNPVFYVIKSGDNLGTLAKKCKCEIEDIQALNDISDPNHICVGQKIKLPREIVED